MIIRAALQQTDSYSVVGYIARKRLLEIARAENAELYEKVLRDRQACLTGFQTMLAAIFSASKATKCRSVPTATKMNKGASKRRKGR